jgi:alpha-beta hydrolase superfamily lysophospholipase
VNADVSVYSINLSGHGQSQVRPGDQRTHLLSGWSERLFDLVRQLEDGQAEAEAEETPLPTIEILRQRYRR